MDAILCSAQLGNLTKDERGKCQILEILSFSKLVNISVCESNNYVYQ